MEKRWYRSSTNNVIGGVCAGLANYFDQDPLLIRILAVVLVFPTHGIMALAYIIAWIFVPLEPIDESKIDDKAATSAKPATSWSESRAFRNYLPGALLIGVGLFWLTRIYLDFFDWGVFWSLVIIAAGGALIYSYLRPDSRKSKESVNGPINGNPEGGVM